MVERGKSATMHEKVRNSGLRTFVSVASLRGELAQLLSLRGVADANDEARDIIASVCRKGRFWPVLHADAPIDGATAARCTASALLRAKGAPFAYAVGRAAFRHMELCVDERVLIPRQETEQLVQIVLDRTRRVKGGMALDIGTGSGAIALALATEGNFESIVGTDVSKDALEVASANAAEVIVDGAASVQFVCCNVAAGVSQRGFRAIVSNPPYIAFDESHDLPASVRDWEPAVALYSARNGLRITQQIVRNAAALMQRGGLLALEVDTRRASLVAEMVMSSGFYKNIEVELDLSGRERFVVATKEV